MPGSRHHRKHDDDLDHGRGRGRDERRPRVQHRKSSGYEDRSDRRSGRSRHRRDDYDYYSGSESDTDYDYAAPPPPRRTRHARSRGRGGGRSARSLSLDSLDCAYDDDELSRKKRDQAVKSALTAGAVEAIRQRNRPGEWLGARGIRVATAALSAAAIDSAVDKDPKRKGKRNIVTSTIGGLVIDKLANGVRGRR